MTRSTFRAVRSGDQLEAGTPPAPSKVVGEPQQENGYCTKSKSSIPSYSRILP
jgi:hypothetical protein